MKQRDIIAAAIVVAIMAVSFGAIQYTARYASTKKPTCSNITLQTLPSPDQKFKAIVFERNCGAGANRSAQVSILPIAAALTNEPGNVFVADLLGGKVPYVFFIWHSADGAEVVTDPAARVYKKTDFVGDIVVTFREGM